VKNGTSDLEQEFELEFGDISAADRLGESRELDEEFEGMDEEIGDEELESPDDEFESVDEEFESFDGDQETGSEYVERFMELASRGYESETELDESVNRLLGEMEREYFWGKLKSLAKKGLRSGVVGKLLKTAKGIAGNHPMFKALQGLTSLHRKGLRGLLTQLATTAAAGTPFGGAAMAAMKALDFKSGQPNQEREAWENFVSVSREAYENLAENLGETQSMGAAQQQAVKSLTTAIRNHKTQPRTGGVVGRRRVIRLRPGQRITIVCRP
jgi:hypothetical protein